MRVAPDYGYGFGVPIIRTEVSWGLYWVALPLGNYHVEDKMIANSLARCLELSCGTEPLFLACFIFVCVVYASYPEVNKKNLTETCWHLFRLPRLLGGFTCVTSSVDPLWVLGFKV